MSDRDPMLVWYSVGYNTSIEICARLSLALLWFVVAILSSLADWCDTYVHMIRSSPPPPPPPPPLPTIWTIVSDGKVSLAIVHDDVIKWEHFPRYWTFVTGRFPSKGQWRGALMFSLTCAWTNGWANNRDDGDLTCHRTYCDVTIMEWNRAVPSHNITQQRPNRMDNSWVFCIINTDWLLYGYKIR